MIHTETQRSAHKGRYQTGSNKKIISKIILWAAANSRSRSTLRTGLSKTNRIEENFQSVCQIEDEKQGIDTS